MGMQEYLNKRVKEIAKEKKADVALYKKAKRGKANLRGSKSMRSAIRGAKIAKRGSNF